MLVLYTRKYRLTNHYYVRSIYIYRADTNMKNVYVYVERIDTTTTASAVRYTRRLLITIARVISNDSTMKR